MTILIITRGVPTENNPLNGNFEMTQALALKKMGHEVIVAAIGYRAPNPKYLLRIMDDIRMKHYIQSGIHIYKKYCLSLPSRFIRGLNSNIMAKILIDLYEEIVKTHGKPDIAHAHYLFISSAAVVLKKKYALPLVCTEHWSRMNMENLPNGLYRLGKGTYPFVDRVIAVSQSLAHKIHTNFHVECTVIYNMVDSSFFDKSCLRIMQCEHFKFISVGHLIYPKGHDILIKAFSKANLGEYVTLSIVGAGVEEKNLRKLIRQLGLTERVFLLGLKNKEEVRDLLLQSDAFVLTSRKETFGVVYIEAMAKGLPVIATACGGPEEFVNENNGLLVPVNDVESTAEALVEMYSGHDMYDKSAISEYCMANFSEKEIVRKIVEVYNDVLIRKQ
jgi:glycosyltransferase involved in cell wall biosynthesis